MAFKVSVTEDADRQFRALPVRDQQILEAAIQSQLKDQPTIPTKGTFSKWGQAPAQVSQNTALLLLRAGASPHFEKVPPRKRSPGR